LVTPLFIDLAFSSFCPCDDDLISPEQENYPSKDKINKQKERKRKKLFAAGPNTPRIVLQHPGVIAGHKTCKVSKTKVPAKHGWNWKATQVPIYTYTHLENSF